MKKVVVAMGVAVFPLILASSLVAQPAQPDESTTATTQVSVLAAADASLDRYFAGPIYRQSLGASSTSPAVRAATLSELHVNWVCCTC